MFHFKQFTVTHDRCAMKVGTDGVLLGVWADCISANHILDIGTGTGLIALILAQRNPTAAVIDAVEIDAAAADQARYNVAQSKWHDRITVHHTAIQNFEPIHGKYYDLIVSNPPFFQAALRSPNEQRNVARHAITLPFDSLLLYVARLLKPNGSFSIILPYEQTDSFLQLAALQLLYAHRHTQVAAYPHQKNKRVLMTLKFGAPHTRISTETLYLYRHKDTKEYSVEYQQLTNEFYLHR